MKNLLIIFIMVISVRDAYASCPAGQVIGGTVVVGTTCPPGHVPERMFISDGGTCPAGWVQDGLITTGTCPTGFAAARISNTDWTCPTGWVTDRTINNFDVQDNVGDWNMSCHW